MAGALLVSWPSDVFDQTAGIFPVQSNGPDGPTFFLTRDGGMTWTAGSRLTSPYGFGPPVYCSLDAAQLWADVGQALYRSANLGATWTEVGGLPAAGRPLELDFVDPDHGFVLETVSSDQTVLYRTDDGGQPWSRLVPR